MRESTLRQLEFGQQVYVGLAFFLLLSAFVFMPFRNPLTQDLHWSLIWKAPRYEVEQMDEIVTAELAAKLPAGLTVADEFIENSTTAEMRPQNSIHRSTVLIAIAIAVIGWFIVPSRIDRFAHRVRGHNKAVNGSRRSREF